MQQLCNLYYTAYLVEWQHLAEQRLIHLQKTRGGIPHFVGENEAQVLTA